MATKTRHSARAILIDDEQQVILIKRSKPGLAPYWTLPGGGIEDTDESPKAALIRELFEELGATATKIFPVFSLDSQNFFVARLATMDQSQRTGSEFADASRGDYDVERIGIYSNELSRIDLKPLEIKEFILENKKELLGKIGFEV